MTRYIVIFFLLFVGIIHSQNSINTKEIKKVFKSKGGIRWYACNNDSAYFRNDTIKLFKRKYSPDNKDCCSVVSWDFVNKNEFTFRINRPCGEPVSSTTFAYNRFLKVKNKDDNTFLKIYVDYQLEERFKVIDFKKYSNPKIDDIIYLLRIK